VAEERKKALTELELNKDEKYLFDLASEMLFLKGYRKETLVLGYYLIGRLAKEVSKRTHIPFNSVRFLLPKEFVLLLEDKFDLPLKELIERQKYMVFITGPKDTEILLGKKAKDYFNKHVEKEKVLEAARELKGSIASPGLVKGIVKIVNTVADMEKMEEGNILVSSATQPDLLPAMKRAAAIITDVGGMTCHAAIVSRELGKPCVIGTRKATKVFKDGDLVEVDASHGRVKKVK
jgi:phosphoenolpyruvate synthase/pyruvate phosphate dikinase